MSKCLALIFLAAASLIAQEFRGSILGRVADTTGAVVPGVRIRITNIDTNVTVEAVSNSEGLYQAPFLLPGNYRLTAAHAGFRTIERPQVRVPLNTQVTVDLVLEVGQSAETVTVRASAPLLNTASADLGQVVERTLVDSISVSLSRNAVNLAQLAPGVTGSTGTYTSNAQSTVSITGGGSTRGRNEYLLDGIPNTVPASGGLLVYVPSLDSVEEVKVQTTLFDAAYGHSNGGAVNITTRSGTNELHGAVYDFHRWRALNANTWNNNRAGAERAPVNYNQWGYTVGGPVYLPKIHDGRNRTFFATTLERDSDKRDLFRQARVPTELERRGDFSQTLNQSGQPLQIYDPLTTVQSGNTASRQPFANARIPASRMNPTGMAALNALPLPTRPDIARLGQFNWSRTGIYTVSQRQASGRIDHVLSDRQRLFGRFSRMYRDQISDVFFPGAFEFPGNLGTDLGINKRVFTSIALDDTITFSPSFVGSFRYGFARRLSDVTSGGYQLDPSQLNVADDILRNQAISGYPIFRFDPADNLPAIGSSLSKSSNDQHALLATLTKLAGRHAIKFGADYRLLRWNNVSPGAAAPGQFHFSPSFTSADPLNPRSRDTTGSGMASILLGVADNASSNGSSISSIGYTSPLSIQNHYLALFVQEDWKTLPRLTLNFGLRYELETPYTERYNRVSYGFDPNVSLPLNVPGFSLRGGILFAGVNGNPRTQGKTDWNNFGPRFGFAFNVLPRMVIRGGYGLFYSSQPANSSFLGQVASFDAITNFVGSIDNLTPFTTLANPFPNGIRQAQGSSVGVLAQVGDSLAFFDSNRVSPYNQQWQLSIQREFPAAVLLEGAYVGMLSLKQFESFNLNEKPDRFLALGAAESQRVPNPFFNVFPGNTTLGASSTIAQSRLWPAYPQFATLTVNGANTGRSIYHALQARAEKRMSHGLTLVWSYAFSKLIDNYTTSIVNERHYRTVSEFDQTHVMRLAFHYQLPVRFASASFGGKLARTVAAGWSVAGLAQFASGFPLGVTHANGRPIRLRNASTSGSVHDRLGDRRDASGRVINPYLDASAFAILPSPYVVSPSPPYLPELRSPGSRSLNLSLLKDFALRERTKLQVRIESTNVTNTPAFEAPGTNLSQLSTFGVINSAGDARQM